MATRQQMWDRLGPAVDLVVIGGGITGAGIARDAVRRGLSVVLLEQGDFASGTSSRSSKLVHGGLRYLEQYEFSLVFEAVSERRILMEIAPHLVNPLGFLFPVYDNSRKPLWMVNAGMWVYEGLSLFRSPKRHKTLKTQAEVQAEEPLLATDGMTGAPLYYDCSTNDARLTLENVIDAANHGAVVTSWARVVSFVKDGGRVTGVVVEDRATGELKTVSAGAVLNATGPWTDATLAMSQGGAPRLLRPTKGVHIVVPHARLPVRHAVVCLHPGDGRLLFAIPWGEDTYIGTTDTDWHGDPAKVAASRADVDYLLAAARKYFPSCRITEDDVHSTWAGLRPLIAPPASGVAESNVSREHHIVVHPDGLVTVAGGKLTTYRRMAAEVVDTAVNLLRLTRRNLGKLKASATDTDPLPGGVGWPADDDHAQVAASIAAAAKGAIGPDSARLLADTYGMRGHDLARRIADDPRLADRLVPGRPELLVQVDWAVDEELAATPADVLIRRTQLYYRDRDQGLGALPVIAARMAEKLGWSAERQQAEIAAYEAEVALSRAWRSG
ncbi:MAG: glycerol-3-phosphate dehydrogenase [Deltaproteobacteria bacterium]|nr:glycerol-3-phosphate dehydrogenase [Deltaproteobacteria bacterium]